jgi:hypothetical protein
MLGINPNFNYYDTHSHAEDSYAKKHDPSNPFLKQQVNELQTVSKVLDNPALERAVTRAEHAVNTATRAEEQALTAIDDYTSGGALVPPATNPFPTKVPKTVITKVKTAVKATQKAETLVEQAQKVAKSTFHKATHTIGYRTPAPEGEEYGVGQYIMNFIPYMGERNRAVKATNDYWLSIVVIIIYGLLGFSAVTSGAAGALIAFVISVIFVAIASQFGTYIGKYLPMINIGIFGIVVYIVAYIFLLKK